MNRRSVLFAGIACLILSAIHFAIPLGLDMTALVWGGAGAVLLIGWALDRKGKWPWLRNALLLMMGIGLCVLMTVMGAVSTLGATDAAEPADYAVVLGAKVTGQTPSRVLQERLDAALDYLAENPDGIVIVSGGKGDDENAPEAEVMAQYLIDRGADSDRVLLDAEARTTRENLINSAAIIEAHGGDSSRLTVITNDFHMARAKYIGSTLGISVQGRTCKTTPWLLRENYQLREAFAFVKALFLSGAG